MNQQKSGLVPGILVGILAMLVGAGLFGAFIGITERERGIVSIGVGVLVGLGIMAVKPTSPVLPPLAAVMGLVGAALGQMLGLAILLTKLGIDGTPVGFGDALSAVAGSFSDVIGENPLMLVFWAISAAAAFSFVNKRVKEATPGEVPSDAPPQAANLQGWTPTAPTPDAPAGTQTDTPRQDPAPKA
ncbi:hypothetical protein ACIBHX_43245 [Nonomuraea sp. NPDC050536]|uniref:hypothetical protein n=1 Tax=Nonomuraea sp. NPDC050536 TaxID=3364366 RepID=UPI0037C86E0D